MAPCSVSTVAVAHHPPPPPPLPTFEAVVDEVFRKGFMKVVAESLRAYGVDATGADLARDDDTGAAACREALRFLAEQCRAANQRRPAEHRQSDVRRLQNSRSKL